jgi:hypothetical protein
LHLARHRLFVRRGAVETRHEPPDQSHDRDFAERAEQAEHLVTRRDFRRTLDRLVDREIQSPHEQRRERDEGDVPRRARGENVAHPV